MSLRENTAPLPDLYEGLLLCRKVPPTGEHVVDEQRVDGERAGGVSSASSEQKEQREEHAHDE